MILVTKLHIPHTRSAKIQRETLLRVLNEGMNAKLTLVTAPAGYGKTTALCEWSKQCHAAIAWVSLDKYDDSLVRFWGYVIAAIKTAVPAFSDLSHLIMEEAQPEVFLASLLNELNHVPAELVLILDDFHLVENPPINRSITYFLEYLPSHIHLFIASRSEPSISAAKLKARGQLNQITAGDLQFQLHEGIRFFRDCMNLSLSESEASSLVDVTEGWVSGLKLAALSLRKRTNFTEFIRDFGGRQNDISDYLFEETFQHQSAETQTFLLATSILTRMNNSLCEAVTGQTNCQDRLDSLERNMLIFPLDEQRCWYRYHHLFSEFLQHYLKQKYPQNLRQIYAKAAGWLEAGGFVEEAIDHYIAGHHFSDALRLIEEQQRVLMELSSEGIYRWLKAIPEPLLSERPLLYIFNIGVLIAIGELALAENWLQKAQNKLLLSEWEPYAGTVYMFCANLAYIQRDIERASAYYEKFDRHSSNGSMLQMIGGNMNYSGSASDYDNILAYINDLHAADSFMSRWIEAWKNKTGYTYLGYLLVSYSELMYEWNRLEEADFYSALTMSRNDMQPYGKVLVGAAIQASCLKQAYGRIDEAFELLERMKSRLNSSDLPLFIRRIETHKAYLSLIHEPEKPDFVFEWLQSCGLKHTDDFRTVDVSEYLCLSRAHIRFGRMEQAEQILERLYLLVTSENRLRDTIKVLILQSIALYHNKDSNSALKKLEHALTLAEPHGYVRSFVDEGERMKDLLTQYMHLRQTGFFRETGAASLLYVKNLLQHLHVKTEDTMPHSFLLTKQEINILRMIEKGMSNQQIAEHIYVTVNTVKTHVKNMYTKMNVKSRIHAIQRGKELKML